MNHGLGSRSSPASVNAPGGHAKATGGLGAPSLGRGVSSCSASWAWSPSRQPSASASKRAKSASAYIIAKRRLSTYRCAKHRSPMACCSKSAARPAAARSGICGGACSAGMLASGRPPAAAAAP